jgi:hypothetical protein
MTSLALDPDQESMVDVDAGNDRKEERDVVPKGREHVFEETLGDSCLMGRRTLEISEDCVWRLHGGV